MVSFIILFPNLFIPELFGFFIYLFLKLEFWNLSDYYYFHIYSKWFYWHWFSYFYPIISYFILFYPMSTSPRSYSLSCPKQNKKCKLNESSSSSFHFFISLFFLSWAVTSKQKKFLYWQPNSYPNIFVFSFLISNYSYFSSS